MNFDEFSAIVTNSGGTVHGKPKTWKDVNVKLHGHGTSFHFHADSKIENVNLIDHGGLNNIIVGQNSKLTGKIKLGRGCTLRLGKNISCTSGVNYHISEMTEVNIGNNCMFGMGVSIFTHDYHPIFDASSGNRINISKNVTIGQNVWIANEATVLKGTSIGEGSVIGACSIVNGIIGEKCIAAGNPAKIIAENIIWDRASLNTTHPDGINHLRSI
ncbi:acyltransferase [Leclercia adecarboxylata]|uniref:acyltransferase n=1 Tax=Leclercia adecarboxylata TaxID=83655 RepID=UPI0029490937|nr:acyltransferase [Leclercia adecarboxylata]MDV5237852.1 acyltransferase [Leclercia adecarboxylata]MDV5278715.1 acyltransferase [Leclercia adecarboxylata]MDV5463025.1 acyltransferase [Leclercia adecarboxylata]MDV5501827.1 acyltransferase [Leclercia adecarboxylata]MDV5534653.1 acyltransferase [Leclercia adecarboxylata]